MIIWRGFGFLVAVVVFGCSLLMELVTENITGNDQFYQDSVWAFPSALIIAGAIISLVDWLTLGNKSKLVHSLFFIPMKWWGPLLWVIAVGIIIYKSAAG